MNWYYRTSQKQAIIESGLMDDAKKKCIEVYKIYGLDKAIAMFGIAFVTSCGIATQPNQEIGEADRQPIPEAQRPSLVDHPPQAYNLPGVNQTEVNLNDVNEDDINVPTEEEKRQVLEEQAAKKSEEDAARSERAAERERQFDEAVGFEGMKVKVYEDEKDNKTVGVGFNLDRSGARNIIEGLGINYDDLYNGRIVITEEVAKILFQSDISASRYEAQQFIPDLFSHPAPVAQVVTDMVFNMGSGKIQGFVDFKKALDRRDYASAAAEYKDSKMWKDVGAHKPTAVATQNRGLVNYQKLLDCVNYGE